MLPVVIIGPLPPSRTAKLAKPVDHTVNEGRRNLTSLENARPLQAAL
jgi:hypothetical protein